MNNSIDTSIEKLLASYAVNESHVQHLGQQPLPSTEQVIQIIKTLQELIFPGFFGTQGLSGESLRRHVVEKMNWLQETLTEQIRRACTYNVECFEATTEEPASIALKFLDQLPRVRRILATDVKAAHQGDPAATCKDEVISSYPSVYAVMAYRLAHELYKLEVP
jgi:serine O-acetyltransferase